MDLDMALKRLTPEYTAGLIDGEGCITITKTKKGAFQGKVVVEMSSPRLLEAMAVRWGVLFQKKVQRKDRPDYWKAIYRIELTGLKALAFLLEIRNHLIDKVDQAEIAIKFLKHRERVIMASGMKKPRLSPESIALYDSMKVELQQLKRKKYEDLPQEEPEW